MNFLLNYIKGIAIGAGAVLPGISSGVLLVVFGMYDKLINSILDFFSNWKKNLIFLFPIIFGCFIGIIVFGNILLYFYNLFPVQTQFCFIGLILGSLPLLFKQANNKKGFRLHYILYLFLCFFLTFILILIEKNFSPDINVYNSNNFSFIFLIFSGFLMSAGIIIPGVSSTVILMLLGIYQTYLGAISIINIHILFPMGIGIIIGSYIFMKIIKYLLDKYYSQTFYGIIGFVISSILVIFPGFKIDLTYFISLLLFFSCFLVSFCLKK